MDICLKQIFAMCFQWIVLCAKEGSTVKHIELNKSYTGLFFFF